MDALPSDSRPLRVVVADDHPVYREGLARLLSKSGIDVVGQAPNGLAAIEMMTEKNPDVGVIDLNMPGLSGIEVTRRLIERMPTCRVLVVSVSAEEADITEAILAGASGYVLKDAPVEEVVAGIEAAAEGRSLVSPQIAARLLERIRERENGMREAPSVAVSARELQVLKMVAEGRAEDEIGGAMLIGVSTVGHHMASILTKLQMDHRVLAATRATRKEAV